MGQLAAYGTISTHASSFITTYQHNITITYGTISTQLTSKTYLYRHLRLLGNLKMSIDGKIGESQLLRQATTL